MTPEIVIDDLPLLQRRLASEFEAHARTALANRGKFVVALPGGSVATTFLPVLARAVVDWTRTEFFWTDERAVPADDRESNYGIAARLLLAPTGVPAPRIHRMYCEGLDLDEAARRAEGELTSIAGDPPRLDVALLGVGEDGHVASIFPEFAAVNSNELVLGVYNAPKPPSERLSLTLNVLADSDRVIIAAFGRSKASAVRDGIQAQGSTPLARLLRGSRSSLLLLDRGAAELLSGG